MSNVFRQYARTLAIAAFTVALTINSQASPNDPALNSPLPMFTVQPFATGTTLGATQPDSIYLANGSIWVAYQDGADSTGLSGSSTVVSYSLSGTVQNTWTIKGNVDGLRVDPTGLVWALQNNDGNSTLTTINPTTNATTL